MPISEIVLFGVLGALTFGLKLAMAFLPNIEPVSLLVLLFAVVFGWKALYPMYLYVVLEILIYGFSLWNLNYLYVWLILVALGVTFRRMQSPLGWAMLSGAFGLAFGLLCAPVYIIMVGVKGAALAWVQGIPYDLLHCGGNFAMALILFKPLRQLLEKLYGQMKR